MAIGLTAALIASACASTHARDGGDSEVETLPWQDDGPAGHRAVPELPGDGLAPAPWGDPVAERCLAVEPLMRTAAMNYQVDVGLIAGIIRVESSFRRDARSHSGARGLMQVMPKIGRRLQCGDLSDPKRNIACGMKILTRFLDHYDGQVIFGLSAYNAGYKAPNDALSEQVLPSNYHYVEKVLAARVTYLRYGCGP